MPTPYVKFSVGAPGDLGTLFRSGTSTLGAFARLRCPARCSAVAALILRTGIPQEWNDPQPPAGTLIGQRIGFVESPRHRASAQSVVTAVHSRTTGMPGSCPPDHQDHPDVLVEPLQVVRQRISSCSGLIGFSHPPWPPAEPGHLDRVRVGSGNLLSVVDCLLQGNKTSVVPLIICVGISMLFTSIVGPLSTEMPGTSRSSARTDHRSTRPYRIASLKRAPFSRSMPNSI